MARPKKDLAEMPAGAWVVGRLQEAYGVTTIPALAAAMGEKESVVKNWPYRAQVPLEYLLKVQADTGKSVEWLTLKTASISHAPTTRKFEQATGVELLATKGEMAQLPSSFVVVPRYDVRASAGPGARNDAEEQVGDIAFEVNWMRRNLGRAGQGFASIEVRGDSMQPVLLNGDEIIIDRHVTRVDASGIYVISLRGDLLVKRIQRMLDGSLVVKSENTAYEPETVSADRAEDFRVVGRMVWPRVR